MTQEDKKLLLKDLYARILYGFTVHRYSDNRDITFGPNELDEFAHFLEYSEEEEFKPYLRPISSMTEEEMDQLFDILHIDKDGKDEDWIKINDVLGIKFFFPTGKWVENVVEAYDYLNSIHIDYRGLIPMGLALEAPEDMYKTV